MGLGQTPDGLTSDVEAFDFYNPTVTCTLPSFPYAAGGAIGFNTETLICGGHNDTHHFSECYTMNEKEEWTPLPEMHEKR